MAASLISLFDLAKAIKVGGKQKPYGMWQAHFAYFELHPNMQKGVKRNSPSNWDLRRANSLMVEKKMTVEVTELKLKHIPGAFKRTLSVLH